MASNTERITVCLPKDIVAVLKRRQSEMGQPLSWQLRNAVELWFEQQEGDKAAPQPSRTPAPDPFDDFLKDL